MADQSQCSNPRRTQQSQQVQSKVYFSNGYHCQVVFTIGCSMNNQLFQSYISEINFIFIFIKLNTFHIHFIFYKIILSFTIDLDGRYVIISTLHYQQVIFITTLLMDVLLLNINCFSRYHISFWFNTNFGIVLSLHINWLSIDVGIVFLFNVSCTVQKASGVRSVNTNISFSWLNTMSGFKATSNFKLGKYKNKNNKCNNNYIFYITEICLMNMQINYSIKNNIYSNIHNIYLLIIKNKHTKMFRSHVDLSIVGLSSNK
eukprot:492332_1